jgi:hypothetical protein
MSDSHTRLDEDMEDGKMSVEMNVMHDEKEPEKKPEDNSIRARLLTVKDIIIGNKLNILLICIPFG